MASSSSVDGPQRKVYVVGGDCKRNLTHCSDDEPVACCCCDGAVVHSPGGPFGVYQRYTESQGSAPSLKATKCTDAIDAIDAIDATCPPPSDFKLGERGSGLRARGPVQDFNALREQCLNDGSLFEDPEFPAEDASIFFSKNHETFQWLRPKEIVEDPQFFVEGATRFDVQQGDLGNCWLLAAVANLTLNPVLFSRVVPDDQGFEEKYAGIFHFRFWRFGSWVDVVVDDRLPTRAGELVFMHSLEQSEFWSALLEKAYAKLYGSYEALDGGNTCEAMEDFTGGVSEMFHVKDVAGSVFKMMTQALARSSLLGCSMQADTFFHEARTADGLVKGHAYSVTSTTTLRHRHPDTDKDIALVRLRNPWGNSVEWTGAWSDRSPEWDLVPESERREMALAIDFDGEFWMSVDDFIANFHFVEICNLTPDPLTTASASSSAEAGGGGGGGSGGRRMTWEVNSFEGEWVRGVTAGGCANFPETFGHNPQYRIHLKDPDEDDDDDFCTVIIALMQKNRRSLRITGAKELFIGITIYELGDADNLPKPLPADFFTENAPVVRSECANLRQLTCRYRLAPGEYCVVPSTYEPNAEGEFMLRVFTETKHHMEEIDDTIGMKENIKMMKPITNSEETMADKATEYFLKIAGDDNEIDWKELQTVLNDVMKPETHNMGFSKDVCRSMIALMDADKTGKLGLTEFKALWSDVCHWKNVFKVYDKDGSGTLNGFELRNALNSAGYSLNNNILNILVHRYGTKNGSLEFDDYIVCAIKIKAVINMFKEKVSKENERAEFTLEEWVENMLYS